MTLIAVAAILLGVLLCIAMAINDRRKRDETPELDAMLFQREGDDKDG